MSDSPVTIYKATYSSVPVYEVSPSPILTPSRSRPPERVTDE
jgi:hypothetical protein